MMEDNLDISELYYDSAISGESYLYCVENNISSIDELRAFDFSSAPEAVRAEICTILPESRQTKETDNECDSEDEIVVANDATNSWSQINLTEVYPLALELTLDVRATNILKQVFWNCNEKPDAFASFYLTCAQQDLMRFRNCGRKTIDIILDVRNYILSTYTIHGHNNGDIEHKPYVSKATKEEVQFNKPERQLTRAQINVLAPIWKEKFETLSTRARNVLSNCYQGQEWYQVFFKLVSASFNPYQCKNCGRQTAEELSAFLKEMSSVNIDDLPEVDEATIQKSEKIDQYSRILNLSNDSIEDLICLENKLNRFPLLATIQKYIEELEDRSKRVLDGLIDIYNGQELVSRDALSYELGLTGERLRQLRNKVFHNLKAYIREIGQHVEVFDYVLNATTKYNEDECTNFQDNFIYFILSLCNSRWTIIGDIGDVFFNPYGHQINLNIVSTALAKEFDFQKFLRSFDDIYKSKRTTDLEINLASYCLDFFKREIQIAMLENIVYECKKIVLRLYDCSSNGDVLLLGSNAYKGRSEAIEEILRNNGRPMSAKDIYQVLQDNYPDIKCKNISSVTSAIHTSSNIQPVGRSGMYVLVGWDDSEYRGGTIREFSEEFLLDSPDKIASISDIGNYVRQFRPSASDASIQSNLLAEANNKFSLYTKNDVKYIGFSGRDYDPSYVPAQESFVVSRAFSVSRRMFEEFIVANNRFPFASGDDIDEEERRLGRFWQNLQNKIKRNAATEEELEMVEYIENTYPYQNIPKNEYKWRNSYDSICSTLRLGGKDFLSDSDQRWCYKYIQRLKTGQLEAWQVPLILNLIDLYAKG